MKTRLGEIYITICMPGYWLIAAFFCAIELAVSIRQHNHVNVGLDAIFLMWCLVVYYAIKRKTKNATPNN